MPQPSRLDIALTQIDDWISPDGVGAAAAALWHRGAIVAERYAGEIRDGVATDETTLFALASVTKPVTGAALIALATEGTVSIDDLVVELLPDFAEADFNETRSSVTLAQLLKHTSGLPEDLPRGTFRSRDLPTLTEITDHMLVLPLQYTPDEQFLYSNAGYAVLGRLVEEVTGNAFWDVVESSVLRRLHLENLLAQPGRDLDDRIAIVEDPRGKGRESESYNSPYWRDLGIPWGGMYGSARDVVTFAGEFLSNQPSLFDKSWIDAMITDQVGTVPGTIESLRISWPAASWGWGWEVKGPKRNHWTGDLTSPATFCHFGASGTLLWGDPEHDVALAVFGNRTTAFGWPFTTGRWSRLSNSIVEAVS